jgi:hypothetical protein
LLPLPEDDLPPLSLFEEPRCDEEFEPDPIEEPLLQPEPDCRPDPLLDPDLFIEFPRPESDPP